MHKPDDLCALKSMHIKRISRDCTKFGFVVVVLTLGAASQLYWLSRTSLSVIGDSIRDEPDGSRESFGLDGSKQFQTGSRVAELIAVNTTLKDDATNGDSALKGALVANASSAVSDTGRPHLSRGKHRGKRSMLPGKGYKGKKDLVIKRANRWAAEHAAARAAAGDPPEQFPESTVLGHFETKAAKEEVRRHDRLVVEGMAYMASLNQHDLEEWNLPEVAPSTLCINIMTSQRKIPYVNSLLMMLMRGQTPRKLLEYAKINLMNIERRPEHIEYRLVKDRLARLPFVSVYNITKDYPAGPGTPFQTTQRINTIAAFDACISSSLPFCLLIEDDAVTPMNFIEYFDKFVRSEMEKPSFNGSSVSLHSYHSHFASNYQVDLMDEYHIPNGTYDNEVSKTNSQLRHLGQPTYIPSFKLIDAKVKFGTVANVFTFDMAKKVRDYLVSIDEKADLPFPDVLMFNPKYYGKRSYLSRRVQVEPSLVNHIGFYSEINKGKSFKASDVRFQLDAGD